MGKHAASTLPMCGFDIELILFSLHREQPADFPSSQAEFGLPVLSLEKALLSILSTLRYELHG